MDQQWLTWAKNLQAIAQAGLAYSKDPYDLERFEQIRRISIEIVGSYTGIGPERVRDLFAGETGYQTPKVDVRAAIFNDRNEILLVREQTDGRWSMPGGWADAGLSLSENIIKECREEAGMEVLPKKLIAILDRARHTDDMYPYSVYKIFVECDWEKKDFNPNIETSERKFFPQDHLPDLSAIRITEDQIRMCFRSLLMNEEKAIFE